MRHYSHLTIEEREMILQSSKDMSLGELAKQMGRSKSTLSRELRRNASPKGYGAHRAQQAYEQRRVRCRRKTRLADESLRAYVEDRLNEDWSPEQIEGFMDRYSRPIERNGRTKKCYKGMVVVAYSTIYRALKNGELDVDVKQHLRRKGRKPSPHSQERRGRLHGHKTIHQRPALANKRLQVGHFEGDTLRGGLGMGCACTYVDRKTRFTFAGRMLDRRAETLNAKTIQLFGSLPPELRRTITDDHGNEFFSYAELEEDLPGTKVYFADPHRPDQRGTNENTNGLLRQYFPKKFDFRSITDEQFQAVIDQLNNRPRKILGFLTPAEAWAREVRKLKPPLHLL
jgi:IS30 family transposase